MSEMMRDVERDFLSNAWMEEWKEGWKEGWNEGIQKSAVAIAEALLREGMVPEEVGRATCLSQDQIQEIAAHLHGL